MNSSTGAAASRYFDVKPAMALRTSPPVVGRIYRDASGRSFAVLHIAGSRALREYADGAVIAIELRNWPLLHPQSAVF
jgi:hypothetical protein